MHVAGLWQHGTYDHDIDSHKVNDDRERHSIKINDNA